MCGEKRREPSRGLSLLQYFGLSPPVCYLLLCVEIHCIHRTSFIRAISNVERSQRVRTFASFLQGLGSLPAAVASVPLACD